MRLTRGETFLLIIDVQEKLMPVIDSGDAVVGNIVRLIRGAHVLDVAPILTEQYVRGLGPTVEPVRRALEETFGYEPLEKNCFSAAADGEFLAAMRMLKKKHVVVCGVETHVCVYQTVADLMAHGYDVHVVADAVSSRTASNREIALRRMTSDGAKLTSTEMVLFELLGVSGTDEFRAIQKLIK
jgi:nicotinamidase-related amidase